MNPLARVLYAIAPRLLARPTRALRGMLQLFLVPLLFALSVSLASTTSSPLLPPAMSDSSHIYYANQDVDQLRAGLEAAGERSDKLLYRYRLYPLTEDADVLSGIPSSLDGASARELALLAGLWAYRAGEASTLGAIRYGRRSVNLINAAREKDPLDPFVLLIEGQSLLYRPSMAGGNPHIAADRFEQLRTVLGINDDVPIEQEEAMIWHWIALQEANENDRAASLHDELAQADLRPLYRQFLESPPQV